MKSPVSVIMECLTNKKWGHGVDPASIDREAFEKLKYAPISVPKIDHAEEIKKQREHIAANPNGDCDLEHFTKDRPKGLPHGGSSKQTAFVKAELQKMREERAVSMIRANVSELNAAIAKAVEFGIKVEIDTLDHYRSDRPGCPATHLTATISKTL